MPRPRIASIVALGMVCCGVVGLAALAGRYGESVESGSDGPAAVGGPEPRVPPAEDTGDEDTSDEDTGDEDTADEESAVGDTGVPEAERAAPGAPPDQPYRCVVPDLPIPRDPRCDEGAGYPECRWQLPDTDAANGLYVVWRSTTPDHRWARPGLVTLVLAAAREYQSRWPGEHLTVGDLDAAGPRHQTHDRGVDVDLYLEHAMLDVNEGPHRYVDNYAGRPADEVASLRARVTDLARILATCAHGRLRIYYNDPEVLRPFVAWFAAEGLVSDVGPAMTMHNRLHRFHFHMTVPEDLPPLLAGAPGPG